MTIQEVLKLKKWAVVGASNKKGGLGNKIYKKLKQAGYKVYPVSPNYDLIDGDQAYKSVLDIPEAVDVAVFIIKPGVALKVIPEIIQAQIDHVWLQPMSRSEEMSTLTGTTNLNVIESCVLHQLK